MPHFASRSQSQMELRATSSTPCCDSRPKKLRTLAIYCEIFGLLLAAAGGSAILYILTQRADDNTKLNEGNKATLLAGDAGFIIGMGGLITASILMTAAYRKMPRGTLYISGPANLMRNVASSSSSATQCLLPEEANSARNTHHSTYLCIGIGLSIIGVSLTVFGMTAEDFFITEGQRRVGPVGATCLGLGAAANILNFVLLYCAIQQRELELKGAEESGVRTASSDTPGVREETPSLQGGPGGTAINSTTAEINVVVVDDDEKSDRDTSEDRQISSSL